MDETCSPWKQLRPGYAVRKFRPFENQCGRVGAMHPEGYSSLNRNTIPDASPLRIYGYRRPRAQLPVDEQIPWIALLRPYSMLLIYIYNP